MRGYSYVIPFDSGFAPNPFGKYLTLATCKPVIRRTACAGDWVFGFGSKKYGHQNMLVYAMKIEEKLTYNEYWNDKRFQYKKTTCKYIPEWRCGDNIYHTVKGKFVQEKSYHSNHDGTVNTENLTIDTRGIYTLVSSLFYYFGEQPIHIPKCFHKDVIKKGPGYKIFNKHVVLDVEAYLSLKYTTGMHFYPNLFTSLRRMVL